MEDANTHPYPHRFPVDLHNKPGDLEARLTYLLRLLPTGDAERIEPFGFVFRREPDAFSAIAAGMMLGTALLLIEYTWHAPFRSLVAQVLSLGFFLVGLLLLWRFIRNSMTRIEILAEGHEVVIRTSLWRFSSKAIRHDVEPITSVIIVQKETQRVMLGGPRHTMVGEVFRTQPLDPDRLASWMAESTALVARRASLLPHSEGRHLQNNKLFQIVILYFCNCDRATRTKRAHASASLAAS